MTNIIRFYKDDDLLLKGLLDTIRDFAQHLSNLVFKKEFNYEQINKAILDLQDAA